MQTTALVLNEPRSASVRTLELPDPGPDEILIRVEAAGICGTDVEMYEGGFDVPFPVVPGHEFVGRIEEVGADSGTDSRGHSIEVGDSVTVVPGIPCGECWFCRNTPARPTACRNRDIYGMSNIDERPYVGGMSRHLIVHEDAYFYRLPEGVSMMEGVLTEPLSVATYALQRASQPGLPFVREGFGVGQSVLVQGAGPIGLLTAAAARVAGAGQILVLEPIENRRRLVEGILGMDTLDPTVQTSEALVDAVWERTPGGVGPDVVVEAAGVPAVFRQALRLVRDGGTVVTTGNSGAESPIDLSPSQIVNKDLDIYGSFAYPPTQFEVSLSVLQQLKHVPLDRLFDCEVGFKRAEQAYERQAAGEAFKPTVHPWRE